MIGLRKITPANVYECFDLSVAKEQEGFVASNMCSLAEAYAHNTNSGFATPYAIYDGDAMVGFIMYTYFHQNSDPVFVDIKNVPCYYIWRLLIDKKYQRKGYGRQAVEKIIDEIKTMPHGAANRIFVSWEPKNIASKTLFSSFGFYETGEVEGDKESGDYEIVGRLDL